MPRNLLWYWLAEPTLQAIATASGDTREIVLSLGEMLHALKHERRAILAEAADRLLTVITHMHPASVRLLACRTVGNLLLGWSACAH